MKTSVFTRFVVVLLAMALVSFAADVTGKWTGNLPGRDGSPRETTLTLKVAGEKVTGTLQRAGGGGGGGGMPVEITEGKTAGDDVSFSAAMGGRGGQGAPAKWVGKAKGAEIEFTVTREGAEPTKVVMKKSS